MNWITQWISLIFKKLFSYLKHIGNNYWPLTISGLDQIGSTPETLSLNFCHLMKCRSWSHPVWSGFAKASNKWPSYCLFAWLYTVQNWKNKKIYILSCVIINLVFLYLALFSLNPSSPNIKYKFSRLISIYFLNPFAPGVVFRFNNPFAPGDFAERLVLRLVKQFSGHCRAIKS